MRKMKEFGGEEIHFSMDEIKSFDNIFEMGIDIVGMKPFYCDPMYHFHAPYFITCSNNSSKGNIFEYDTIYVKKK